MNALLLVNRGSHGSPLRNKLSVNANGMLIEGNYPISVDYNIETEEIIVANKTDIRCIDAITGKTKRLLAIEESEITKCQVYFDRTQILVCK